MYRFSEIGNVSPEFRLVYRNGLESEAISDLPIPDPDDLDHQSFCHEDLAFDMLNRGIYLVQSPDLDHLHSC